MARAPLLTGNYTSMSVKSQASVTTLLNTCVSVFGEKFNIRQRMKEIDKSYLRQTDSTETQTRAANANKEDPTKFQNVIVPVVKPQVEIAVSKLVDIFLTGKPIFGVSAMPPYQDAAMQMESILIDQEEHGGWGSELQSCFRDGKKYNLMMAEVAWEKILVPRITNDVSSPNTAKVIADTYWEGNVIRRLDLYNSFWDLRCAPHRLHAEGEFAGYNKLMSKMELIRLMWKLGNTQMNRQAALESTTCFTNASAAGTDYHVPDVNPKAVVNTKNASFSWANWFGQVSDNTAVNLAGSYVVTTFYVRLIPADHDMAVPAPKTPAVWKFVIVNGQHIIYAEQLRSAHEYLPIVLSTMDCGDLGYQETGLADEMAPFQALASAYANAGVASMRKAVGDRMFYDPTKVEKKDIENPNPSSKIPVKSAQYGRPLGEAVLPVPYNDNISGIALSGVQQVTNYANQASGQNPAQQGQFVKGNKTLHEYSDVMANASGRNMNTAMNVENNFMAPIKEILKLNILQFQQSGTLYNEASEQVVTVDPTMLRNAVFKFKVSDGASPADKVMNAEAFSMAFQMIATSPALQAEYNVGELATFLLKQQRADVSHFQKPKEQVAYEQAMQTWQQVAMAIAEGKNPNAQIPPQPTPEQFGWNPGNPNKTVPASDPTGKPAIMQQVSQILASQQNSGAPNPQPNQPPSEGVMM